MLPLGGYAEELYSSDAPYKCSPIKLEKHPIVRKAIGKNAHVALDILYQDRGKMIVYKLSDAENIRKDMIKFSMRNSSK